MEASRVCEESGPARGVELPIWRARSGRERGQTLAVIALVLVVLMAFLALVVDMGNLYSQRRLMQNAADAGALAGARALALNKDATAIQQAVLQYAVTRNGAQSYGLNVLTMTLTVTVNKTFPTYFAGAIGIRQLSVQALAEGEYEFPGSWQGNLMPIAVHKDQCIPGKQVEIWDDDKMASDSNMGIIADGERAWLNFDGGTVGDSELVDWVTNGYQERVDVGDWVNGTPGSKTSALHAVDVVRTNTTIFVPLYDSVQTGVMGDGILDYHIVGFAAFYVKSVVDTGSPKFIKGIFQYYVAAQDGGGDVDSGVRVISLRR